MTRDAEIPGHPPPQGQILIYQDQATRLQVRIEGRTVWLTQAGMAELYQTTPQNITIHLKSIYEDTELSEPATCKEFLQVRIEGDRRVGRSLKHYSLDAILAVGYCVRAAGASPLLVLVAAERLDCSSGRGIASRGAFTLGLHASRRLTASRASGGT